ncbi:hypothetical protein QFC20_006191 [Naganishia adeliensis]|uniref:Uncharacterized protein n=1 Tax=Naganishia adeliensis TaxID=92952 RepID=A0ACC2VDH1_9TREE|nr:hypothetical protein QFC20_006191 [Naganishia adeliensis]
MSRTDTESTASPFASSSHADGQDANRTIQEDLPPLSALFPPLDLPPADPEDYQPPFTDQTCFSWCVQSNHRRKDEYLPICRMICLNVNKNTDTEDDDVRRQILLGKKSSKGKERETDDDRALPVKARRRIRQWISERQLVLFKGDLDGMQQVQTDDSGKFSNHQRNHPAGTILSADGDDSENTTSREQKQRRPIRRRYEDDEWSIETKNVGEEG